jgi:hypothetical protein
MHRSRWISIGFLAGIVTCVVSWPVVYSWLLSPVRIVEGIIGFPLPDGLRVTWQRDQHDAFFGQGATLTIFSLPANIKNNFITTCPPGFESGTFEQSGIPPRDVDIDGQSRACIFIKEVKNRQDKIVFVDNKLVHLRIDS